MATGAAGSGTPVIVVGAGPVGLAAALALRARGLPAAVLEAESEGRVRPGSRAIYIHGATLRVLDRLHPGLGRELADHGLTWPTRRTFYRGRQVFARTYDAPAAAPGKLPHFTSLPQVEAERLLLEACKNDDVEIVWNAPVDHAETDPDGVTLVTAAGERWQSDYLVAADGARSAVRRSLGIDMTGDRSPNSYVIADVEEYADDPLPLERVFHYEHPGAGGRNVLLVPFAGGWRADLQCEVGDDAEAFSSGAGLRQWIAASLGERYADRLTWVSTYQFLQVIAERFVDEHHRALLVGEAAHLFAPFGARGMNSGVADADAAVAAIAGALGARSRALAVADVKGFARARLAAAQSNREAAAQALAHLTAARPVDKLTRVVAAQAARVSERAGEWLDTAPYGPRTAPTGTAGGKY